MHFVHHNWLAILVAALAGFPLGFLWYGPLFGKRWMAVAGITPGQGKAANPVRLYGTVLVLNMIVGLALSALAGGTDWRVGLHTGLIAGIGFAATGLGINYLFEFKARQHWLINAGYLIVYYTVVGTIIGAWH